MSDIVINLNKTQYDPDRWFMDFTGEKGVSFTRVGHHLIYDKIDQYGRWLLIPFSMPLEKGGSYILYLELKTNFSKKNLPVYVMNKEKKHQRVGDINVEENDTMVFGIAFDTELEDIDHIMITATDFPVSGERLTIKDIDLEKIN